MDILFIPAKYKVSSPKNIEKLIEILPKEVGLACLVQYLDFFKEIKRILEKKGFKIYTRSPYYILGCYIEAADLPTNTILLLGNGKFHAMEIIRRLNKRVIVYDPLSGSIDTYKEFKYKVKIVYLLEELKYSSKIGIVFSIKPGQYRYNLLKRLLEKLKDKEIYLFIGDNIKLSDLANFPYIEFWIIAACPRILDDILNSNVKALTADILLESS